MSILFNRATAKPKPINYSALNQATSKFLQSGTTVTTFNEEDKLLSDDYQIKEGTQTTGSVAAGTTVNFSLSIPANIHWIRIEYIGHTTATNSGMNLYLDGKHLMAFTADTTTYIALNTPIDDKRNRNASTLKIDLLTTGGIGTVTLALRVKYIQF